MSNQETEFAPEQELELEEQEIIEGQGSDEEPESLSGNEISDEEKPEDSKETSEVSERKKTDSERFLDNLRRDNFRYQNKIQELMSQLAQKEYESAQLRQTADLSIQTAIGHHEIAAKERLDRAKSLKNAAIESGDPKAITDADIALSEAVFNYEKVKGYKAEQELQAENEQISQQLRQQQMYQQPQYDPYANMSQEAVYATREWARNNDWCNPNSNNYDYEKHMLAESIVSNLDNFIAQTGRQHLSKTREYYDAIDQELAKHYKPSHQGRTNMAQQNTRQPQMQQTSQSRNVVAPVKGRGSVGTAQRYSKPLPSAHRDMLQRLKSYGVTEERYRKSMEQADRVSDLYDQYKAIER